MSTGPGGVSTGSVGMAVYQVLYWRDIPAQVRVYGGRSGGRDRGGDRERSGGRDRSGDRERNGGHSGGRRPLSRQMPDWFQQEIDRVAMRDGLTGTDAYLDEWHWSEKQEWTGEETEVEAVAEALLKQLEDGYDKG